MFEGNVCVSMTDWYSAGLTDDQFKKDSSRGLLKIARRGINGGTLIAFDSIVRADRRAMIERIIGKAEEAKASDAQRTVAEKSAEDADWFRDKGLNEETVMRCTKQAALFRSIEKQLKEATSIHAQLGKPLKSKDFWENTLGWQIRECMNEGGRYQGVTPYRNVRSLQRAFQKWCKDGLGCLIPKNTGNSNAQKVSRPIENLIIALWRQHDKPFVSKVYTLYHEWLRNGATLFDKETGEVFEPQEYGAKPVSDSTIWRILKSNANYTAIYADRNGHFDYQNSLRPKHVRKHGQYSLSKISMDDVALSRKSAKGWAYKYIAVDVVSGYYFRPAYVVGKPSISTVYESFRNMFIELMALGLGCPLELEVEYHLMDTIEWLDKVFPFIRFCQSPTEKRAEHNIKSLKWGTAKSQGHTRGRWYAKHEAYRSIRNKVDGDYTEPEYDLRQVIADDLMDIERHNNEPHPDQKTYPGMTRRDVLLKYANPNAQKIEPSRLYRYLGNETATSIRNNDYVRCCNGEYALTDFASLNRLAPNNRRVTAYWLPEDDGSTERVYLYQGDTYIGEATNRNAYAYNECQAERTDEDLEKMMAQNKRIAKFDKIQRERRAEIPQIGIESMDNGEWTMDNGEWTMDNGEADDIPLIIEENEQPRNYEQDEFNSMDNEDPDDLGAMAIDMM